MTNVTLVRPPSLVSKGTLQEPITPPIGVAYLAASLRAAGHKIAIVDALGEAPFRRVPCFDGRMIVTGLSIDETVARIPEATEVAGISCMFSQDWPYTQRIVQAIRRRFPRALIVAGGEHVTALAAFILETCPEIDLCVLGEGEEAIVEIANCAASRGDPSATPSTSSGLRLGASLSQLTGIAIREDGRPMLTPPRARIRNIDAVPPPAWDLTPINNYLDNRLGFGVDRGRSMPVLASRGCPYQCTFCSSPGMWTTRWQARDPALLLDEIQDYIDRYQAANVDFYDLTAIVKREWILTLCRMIEQRGMKFTWQFPSGTRSEALDAEVCRALYRAGCRNLTYAPESGSPAMLKRVKKRIGLDNMMGSMRAAIKAGMNIKTNMIMGFPDETRREAWQTVAFMARMGMAGVHDMAVAMFSPYPGSELFGLLRERGKMPDLNEEYFLSLASYTDLIIPTSWCDNLSIREMSALRLVAVFAFYGAQYAVRPWRLVRTLYNVASNRQESRGEKSLHDFIQRRVGASRMMSAAQQRGDSRELRNAEG